MKYGGDVTTQNQLHFLQVLEFQNAAHVQSKVPVAALQKCLEQIK